MKNAEEFFKDLKENKELADGLMAVLTLAKQESEDEAMAQILRFANENGYEIQAKDLKIKSGTELSDEELELVGGGGFLSRLTQFCLRNIVGPENVIKI